MPQNRFARLLCVAAAAFLVTAPALAATLTVTNGGDAGAGSLRQALIDSSAGDTIEFAAGVTVVNLTSGSLNITRSVTIAGPGSSLLTIRRSASLLRVFAIDALLTVNIADLTIADGLPVSGGGGGIDAGNSIVNLDRVVLTGNKLNGATSLGGAIRNAGTMTLVDCTISGNEVGGTGKGGAIYNAGTLTIVNSTISGNQADGSGQGIYNFSGTLTITGSTISGNADGPGDGGGVAVSTGTVTITNSTITANHAYSGGGIYHPAGGAIINVRNSIVAGNTAASGTGPDVNGLIVSKGYILIGSNANAVIALDGSGTEQIGPAATPIDPMLGPLQDNGGLTKTHALLAGSPAIEAGNSSGATIDQRGLARLVDSATLINKGDGADIGAYEVQADILPGCSNLNRIVNNGGDTGVDSLRDVIAKVCAGSAITFAPGIATVTLTSAELLIDKSLTITGPGAGALSVRRSAAGGTPLFRIFRITAGRRVALSRMTIANGSISGQSGGGIHNSGVLALDDVALSGNVAMNGGGLHNNFGDVTVSRSTISGNSVSNAALAGSGGGIFVHGGTLALKNSTVSGNSAIGPGGNSDSGGGIFNNTGTVLLTGTTIANNSGDIGGGIRNLNGGTGTAKSTIIALNTSPSGRDINGPLASAGFNIVGDMAGATVSPIVASDLLGASSAQLALGPLQDNGGPTATHALLAGSVAIDRGHSSRAPTDQRGRLRVFDVTTTVNAGDGADAGAFEYGDGSIDIDGNHAYEPLTDGLLILRYLFSLSGTALTGNAIGAAPARSSPADIKQFLDGVRVGLDVDGNAQLEPLADGLLLIRYLFGLRGAALTTGAVGAGATRTPAQIQTYIQSLMPQP